MPADFAIHVQNLTKNYGTSPAVAGLEFSVRQGEIFSLLGPNGAGKSTTIAVLCGLLAPTAGDVVVMGHSITAAPLQVKHAIGVVPQEIALYEDLSARQNLLFWGRMYGLSGGSLKRRVDEVLAWVALTDRQNECAARYSGGMKRRLNIGIALLHEPRVVIMDEPTVGIDPQSRRRILDGVKELNQRGATVLYTTHYMEEAEELSDRIAIMDHGKIIAQGTHAELTRLVGGLDRVTLTLSRTPPGLLETWRELAGIQSLNEADGTIGLLARDSAGLLPVLFESCAGAGVHVTGMQVQEPDLEAVFLSLTGKALRE